MHINLFFGRRYSGFLFPSEQTNQHLPTFAYIPYYWMISILRIHKIISTSTYGSYCTSIGTDISRCTFRNNDSLYLVIGFKFRLINNSCHLSGLYIPINTPFCNLHICYLRLYGSLLYRFSTYSRHLQTKATFSTKFCTRFQRCATLRTRRCWLYFLSTLGAKLCTRTKF